MLRIGAWFTKHHGARRALQRRPGNSHTLAKAFHFQLLQMRRQARQALIIGQHGAARITQPSHMPDFHQRQQHRQVFGKWRIAEVLIHHACASQQPRESIPAKCEGE